MLKASVMALALFVSFHSPAFAAEQKKSEGQSAVKIEDAKGDKNVVKSGGEDMDQVITNKRMRAEAGSKSKHSINTALAYNGSTLEKPFADTRPNLRGKQDATTAASLGGSIAYKYSHTKTVSSKLGLGVRWITPFSGSDIPDNYPGDKNDLDNPFYTFQTVSKWGPGIQTVLAAGPTLYTQANQRNRFGMYSNLGISANNAIEIGSSGFSVGLLTAVSATQFDNHTTAFKNRQQDYDLGAYPFLEYVINDTFNIRTISGLWTYSHRRQEKRFLTFAKDTIYQSIGVGISVTRDIFLYPNVQIVPEDIRADRTNVALSTNINVF